MTASHGSVRKSPFQPKEAGLNYMRVFSAVVVLAI